MFTYHSTLPWGIFKKMLEVWWLWSFIRKCSTNTYICHHNMILLFLIQHTCNGHCSCMHCYFSLRYWRGGRPRYLSLCRPLSVMSRYLITRAWFNIIQSLIQFTALTTLADGYWSLSLHGMIYFFLGFQHIRKYHLLDHYCFHSGELP